MLTHYDFTKIVQTVREYRCSSLSGTNRRQAFTLSYDLPVLSLHVDPTKGHHSTWAATSMAATHLATIVRHCLKLVAIVRASLELVLLFIY